MGRHVGPVDDSICRVTYVLTQIDKQSMSLPSIVELSCEECLLNQEELVATEQIPGIGASWQDVHVLNIWYSTSGLLPPMSRKTTGFAARSGEVAAMYNLRRAVQTLSVCAVKSVRPLRWGVARHAGPYALVAIALATTSAFALAKRIDE
eukprot:6200653-Pleurochrysis_carterae.AAC.1